MTVGGRAISACLIDKDDTEVSKPSVSRSEALALVDRFCAAVAEFRNGPSEPGSEVTLSFSRDPVDDFIELSAFGPDRFDARLRCERAWKLFFLIPMRRREHCHLLLRRRDEAAELVDAYVTASDPVKFGDDMLRRGATRHRMDL